MSVNYNSFVSSAQVKKIGESLDFYNVLKNMNDNLQKYFMNGDSLPATVVVDLSFIYLLQSMSKENCFLIDEIDEVGKGK